MHINTQVIYFYYQISFKISANIKKIVACYFNSLPLNCWKFMCTLFVIYNVTHKLHIHFFLIFTSLLNTMVFYRSIWGLIWSHFSSFPYNILICFMSLDCCLVSSHFIAFLVAASCLSIFLVYLICVFLRKRPTYPYLLNDYFLYFPYSPKFFSRFSLMISSFLSLSRSTKPGVSNHP